eukprot:15918_6
MGTTSVLQSAPIQLNITIIHFPQPPQDHSWFTLSISQSLRCFPPTLTPLFSHTLKMKSVAHTNFGMMKSVRKSFVHETRLI